MADNEPIKGSAYTFKVGLSPAGGGDTFQADPTLAAGDVKVSKDDGSLSNITTLPSALPASGKIVKVSLSATEMDADDVVVVFSDAAGSEWQDKIINIKTQSLMIRGTVDTGTFTPTTTQFECDDITEATADHYNGRVVIFTSGVLDGQAARISDYALSGSNGKFTVSAMTEAPGNNDTLVIV